MYHFSFPFLRLCCTQVLRWMIWLLKWSNSNFDHFIILVFIRKYSMFYSIIFIWQLQSLSRTSWNAKNEIHHISWRFNFSAEWADLPLKQPPLVTSTINHRSSVLWEKGCLIRVGLSDVLCDFLTHGRWEDDNPQYVHAFARTGHDLVLDVGSRGDLQEDWVAQMGIVVVGHDIHIVSLRLFYVWVLHNRHQICPVLEWGEREQPQRCVNMWILNTELTSSLLQFIMSFLLLSTHLLKSCFN